MTFINIYVKKLLKMMGGNFMRFKKVCASLLSGILAVGALLTPLSNSIEVFKTNDISITAEQQVL